MKLAIRALCCIFLAQALSRKSQAEAWRGLVPLHSTRADVEKLLGPPPPPPTDGMRLYKLSKLRSIYFLDEGEVYIVYAEPEDRLGASCPSTILAGTVLLIQVTPKKTPWLADLRLAEQRLKKFDPSEPSNIGFAAYVDEEAGISVRTLEDKIQQVNYFAAAKDRPRCPSYYASPKWFCEILVDFAAPGRRKGQLK